MSNSSKPAALYILVNTPSLLDEMDENDVCFEGEMCLCIYTQTQYGPIYLFYI